MNITNEISDRFCSTGHVERSGNAVLMPARPPTKLMCFVVFFSQRRQIPEEYLKVGHNRYFLGLSDSLFTIIQSLDVYNLSYWLCN
jgi:hypothetical protein